ncbi:MAG: type I DNA topoisomerase [Deltaproteobacteria bacterium]|nr:type I DNA topoisomerase [Deltaproteobacteria bacterium]
MSKPLVIVESPTKQRLIQKFLGNDYVVEASVGHIRDIPEPRELPEDYKKGPYAEFGVDIEADFKPLYVVDPRKKAKIKELKDKLKSASALYLATDEDREGESISWHLVEELKPRVPVKRMVFHEITPEAIRHALASPRAIDQDLVSAQETRRVIDRLFGFATSRVLWRKLRGARSAGRVQTPAVRLLVERERARMAFRASDWWSVEGIFGAQAGAIPASLVEVGGKRTASGRDFDETTGKIKAKDALVLDEAAAQALVSRLLPRPGRVDSVDSKPWHESPRPPFTTSTIQQEANRKLRWGADRTMKVAQRLYESGWITYMRTDSFALSDQAITAARTLISSAYGPAYLPPAPRRYKSTAKNAQEAHEAIRPAGTQFRSIEEARRELDADGARLYELVWKRTVACQMADAGGQGVTVRIAVDDARFVATGRTIDFPGYRRAYVEGSDDPEAELADQERILPPVKPGDSVAARELHAKGHTTQPPARLTEATLIKELERLGIGRPSTYADIIQKIIERNYAFQRATALVPTHAAFLLTAFLESQLAELAAYDFTAKLEEDLDQISLGKARRAAVLSAFYKGDRGLRVRLDASLASRDDGFYRLPLAGDASGRFHVRVGQYGAYVTDGNSGTANIPGDMAPDEVTEAWADKALQAKADGPRSLGHGPGGKPVFLFNGRFGPYVQLGEAEGKEKPPRSSLPEGITLDTLTLQQALGLLALPRALGHGPGGEQVTANIGRFGQYVKMGDQSRSLAPGQDVLTVTLADALALLAQSNGRVARRGKPEAVRELGADPQTGKPMKLMAGRFGPYVTDGETNATLPKGASPDGVTLEEAAALLARKREAGPSPKRGRFAKQAARPKADGSAKKAPGTKKKATTARKKSPSGTEAAP